MINRRRPSSPVTQQLSRRARAARRSPRGSVYILVVATGALAAVASLGAVAIAQATQRGALAAAEWDHATLAAESGMELALARVNQDATWRRSIVSGNVMDISSVGGAGVRLAFVDETDGNIASGLDPVRIYSAATVGSSLRVLSVLCNQSTPKALDVLRCSVHASGTLTLNGSTVATGGPLSSNSLISATGTVTGNLEAPTVSVTGTQIGFSQNGASVKAMPGREIAQTLIGRAQIVSLVLNNTTYSSVLWSAAQSPAIVTNSNGIYYVVAWRGQTVTFKGLRVKATLVINLPSSSSLIIANEVLWEPADPSLPSLVILAGNSANITFSGSTNRLQEVALVGNFNPPSTPYQGVSNITYADTYPSVFNGVIHIIGSGANVTVTNNFNLSGCLISESPVTVSSSTTLASDPSLLTSPPEGYTDPANVSPVRGSYRWETASTFRSAIGQDAAAPAGGSLSVGVSLPAVGNVNVNVGSSSSSSSSAKAAAN